MSRTLVIGDVHGCLWETRQLLRKLNVSGTDRVIFLGDLIDKGPRPVETVRFVRESGFECVLGNHEEKHLRWRRHEGRRKLDPTYVNPVKRSSHQVAELEKLSPDEIEWLATRPTIIPFLWRSNVWLAVHAGIPAYAPWQDVHPMDLVRTRFLNIDGRDSGKIRETPGTIYWTQRWQGPPSVVYGHHVHDLAEPRMETPAPNVHCLGIDTGCVYGGALTAGVFDDQKDVFYTVCVKARRAYASLLADPEPKTEKGS